MTDIFWTRGPLYVSAWCAEMITPPLGVSGVGAVAVVAATNSLRCPPNLSL